MGKLDSKIALATGGSNGIGLAAAEHFVGEGAYVFISGRREPELASAVKEIGNNVTGVRSDVSSHADLDRLFGQIQREKGRLDVLFANAGGARYAPLGKISKELYDSIFDINVKGLLFTVPKALPLMPDGASIASIVGSKGFPANSVYSATKAAVRSFARTWTAEVKDRRIRVNAVSPGAIDTPGLNELLASSETGQQRDHRAADFPARLAAACPDGIDVYFENVGGAIWQAVLPLLNDFARVPVSGLIAQYNGVPQGDGTDGLPATMRQILSKRLTVRGFINYDFAAEHYADFLREVGVGIAAGRIRYREDIVDGLENAPEAFIGMLEGRNFGKLIVRVAA